MRKITIQLLTTESPETIDYSIPDDKTVNIELDQETYAKFEQDAKRFGMNLLDALGHGITALIKGE